MSENEHTQGRRYELAATDPELHGQGVISVDTTPDGKENRQHVLFIPEGDLPTVSATAACEALATAYWEGRNAGAAAARNTVCPVSVESTEADTAAERYQLRAQQAAHDAAYATAEGRTSEASHLLTAATCYISAWRAAQVRGFFGSPGHGVG